MNCKWEVDEICTNDKAPVCADYCRGFDAPGLCRFEEPYTKLEYIRAKLGDAELLAQIAEEHGYKPWDMDAKHEVKTVNGKISYHFAESAQKFTGCA